MRNHPVPRNYLRDAENVEGHLYPVPQNPQHYHSNRKRSHLSWGDNELLMTLDLYGLSANTTSQPPKKVRLFCYKQLI